MDPKHGFSYSTTSFGKTETAKGMGYMERIYRKQSVKIGGRMVIRFIAVIIAISAVAAMLTACSANNDAHTAEPTTTEPLEEALDKQRSEARRRHFSVYV